MMPTPGWLGNWAWGLPLIAVTLMIHAGGVMGIALVVSRLGHRTQMGSSELTYSLASSALMIGAVGCALAALHGVEALIWAAAFVWLGALPSFAEAVLYSLDSITTRGAAGLGLAPRWQLMGALESANGVLLFGLSTAFLFVVLQGARPTPNRMAGRHQSELK